MSASQEIMSQLKDIITFFDEPSASIRMFFEGDAVMVNDSLTSAINEVCEQTDF